MKRTFVLVFLVIFLGGGCVIRGAVKEKGPHLDGKLGEITKCYNSGGYRKCNKSPYKNYPAYWGVRYYIYEAATWPHCPDGKLVCAKKLGTTKGK
jgi:hypothetical protein